MNKLSLLILALLLPGCPSLGPADAGASVCDDQGRMAVGTLYAYPESPTLKALISEECPVIEGDLVLWPDTPELPFLEEVQGRVSTSPREELHEIVPGDWYCCDDQLPALRTVSGGYFFSHPSIVRASVGPLESAALVVLRNTAAPSLLLAQDPSRGHLASLGRDGSDEECDAEGLPSGCVVGGLLVENNPELQQIIHDSELTIRGLVSIKDNAVFTDAQIARITENAAADATIEKCGNADDEPCEE